MPTFIEISASRICPLTGKICDRLYIPPRNDWKKPKKKRVTREFWCLSNADNLSVVTGQTDPNSIQANLLGFEVHYHNPEHPNSPLLNYDGLEEIPLFYCPKHYDVLRRPRL